MKNLFSLFTCCLLIAGICISCSNNRNTSISVSETGNTYRFSASFDKSKTFAVQQFIRQSIAPAGLFAVEEEWIDTNTTLADQTKLYIKSSAGKILIKISKKENDYPSYKRIKKMCNSLKDIISGKEIPPANNAL